MFFLTIPAESWDGGDENGTGGKDSSLGELWGLPEHCVSSVPSYWEAPRGSYTGAWGRVRSGPFLCPESNGALRGSMRRG